MKRQAFLLCAAICSLVALPIAAQHSRSSRVVEDPIPLRNWVVPFEQLRNLETQGSLHPAANAVSAAPSDFVAIQPCRAVDTRGIDPGAFGGPIVADNSFRSWILKDAPNCAGIPATVRAYSTNVAVFGSAPGPTDDFVKAFATGGAEPNNATVNFVGGQTLSNAAIVPSGTPAGSITVYALRATHVIIDVNGYFVGGGGVSNLFTYPNPQSGSYSLTIPVGVTRILVEAWGGGGGGGEGFPGGSGAGGGYTRVVIPVSSNATLTITIGGGGTGATVPGGSGMSGGATKIMLGATTLLTAGGGGGGTATTPGAAGTVSGDPSATFIQISFAGPPFVVGVGGSGGFGVPGGDGKAGMLIVTFLE